MAQKSSAASGPGQSVPLASGHSTAADSSTAAALSATAGHAAQATPESGNDNGQWASSQAAGSDVVSLRALLREHQEERTVLRRKVTKLEGLQHIAQVLWVGASAVWLASMTVQYVDMSCQCKEYK